MICRIVNKKAIFIITLCFPLITGCAAVLIGAGAGIGTFTYINGKLIKTYESEYFKCVQASSDALDNLEIPVTERKSDKLKTVIEAKRFDGTPINIEVIRIDNNLTEISIRSGTVGIWDKRVSGQIHNSIEKELVQFSHKDKDLLETKPENNYQAPPKESSDQEVSEIPPEKQISKNIALTEASAGSSSQSNTESKIYDVKSQVGSKFKIFFQENSNEISETAAKTLDQIFEIMINNPDSELIIIGFPDSEDPPPYNKMVSELRVAGVKMYLIGKGLNPSKAKTILSEEDKMQPSHSVEIKINTQPSE